MLKVIGNVSMTRWLIECAFAPFIPEGKDLVIVLADDMDSALAREVAEVTERPMLICSFQTNEHPEAVQNTLKVLLSRDEKVCYARLPVFPDSVMAPIRDIWEGRTPRHTIERVIFLAELKQVLLSEIVGAKTIPGVFCDVNNTLLRDNVVIHGALRRLKKIAGKRDIVLWTTGCLQSAKNRLATANIAYPVVDKRKFSGCVVQVAIDDLPDEKLRKHFWIQAKQFVHTPLGL